MLYKPHDYQQYAEELIINNKASALFLEPGMGKTVITLTAIDELLFNYFDACRVLVIAPLRVADDTWPKEIAKWDHLSHLRISKVLGSNKERLKALNSDADIYIINRENVGWLVDYYKSKWPFDTVVIDELSSFKSSKSGRFKALRKVRPLIQRVVGLTGTPAPNGLIDLWSQVYLLDLGERLGKSLTGFRDRYFSPDKRNQHIIFTYKPKPEAEVAIYNKISDICVSMKSCEYLPERIDNVVWVDMAKSEKALYDKLERDTLLSFADGDINAVNAAALGNKLLQMANGCVYDENNKAVIIHDRKLNALEDLWELGKPILVFYAYKHDKQRLYNFFKSHGVLPRELNTTGDITDWNSCEIDVAIAHPLSTAHGLNLQAGGNIIIWFGLTWSLELYLQANARLHRQGQRETVIIHHIVTSGTIDAKVMQVLEQKGNVQEALLEAVEAKIKGRCA